MRYYAALLALTLTLVPASAVYALADGEPDTQALTMLQGKVERASLRDQCFLYVQLMHGMTELASHQLAAGQVGEAAANTMPAWWTPGWLAIPRRSRTPRS